MKRDLTDTLRGIADGFVDAAQNRLKLLQSEIGEETDRLGGVLAYLVLTALAGMLTLQFAALVVLALVWDTPWRTHAMIALVVLAGIGTGLAYHAFTSRKQRPSPIFATSLDELDKDRRALEKSL
ncbi:MAG: phage holin family protein [Panacagrimonas sp.]